MLNFFTKDLRSKIRSGFLIVLLIMLSLSFWGIYNIYKVSQSVKQSLLQNYTSIIAVDNIGKSIDNMMEATLTMLNLDITAGKTKFEISMGNFYFWYQKAKETAFTEKERLLLDSLSMEYSKFINDFYRKEDFSHIQKNSPIFSNLIESSIMMKNRCYGIFLANHEIIYQRTLEMDRIVEESTIFLLLIVIGGILFSLVFSSKFSDYLTKPLQKLTLSVQNISQGNFSHRIKINSNDEIGKLATEFNKMTEKLEKYEKMNISKLVYEKKKSEIVFESINEPVVMTDDKFNILMVNKSFKETFPANKNKTNLKELLGNDRQTAVERALFWDEPNQILQISDYSGMRYYNVMHSPIILPEAGASGYVFVLSDITKFRELDKMKSEFIGKVSHELKTPLTSVGMALGIMEEEIVGELNEKQASLINSMKEDYNRLNKLVHELLELSRLENADFYLQLATINLNDLVEHIAKNFALQSSEKGVNLITELIEPCAFVSADYEYLFRAIENIVSNALKFTDDKGKIIIAINKEQNNICLSIRDTGVGIAQENIDKIFDKFVQLNENVPGSIGLGLSIAKEIIEMHNGKIIVTSKPGEGTEFKILLSAVENV